MHWSAMGILRLDLQPLETATESEDQCVGVVKATALGALSVIRIDPPVASPPVSATAPAVVIDPGIGVPVGIPRGDQYRSLAAVLV